MAELINSCTERESLGGGVYRQTNYIKPVAYRDGSILKRINTDWADSGISARPHMVSASWLMVSVADDGDFRAHPTREQDKYFEFGAPLINVGGSWVRPGFANRTREGNRIRWTTDHENAYIVHAGHYLKWGILLKNNWDRWSQFAMPVGLTGLTRTGGQLFADGVPVMRLRAPVVYDYDNEEDTRQIEYRFVQQDGQWYALFTLPDLTGMSKPLIDPTLELQPDGAAGVDTYVKSSAPDTSYETDAEFRADAGFYIGLIKFTGISVIPNGSIVTSATLSFWTIYGTLGSSIMNGHSILSANDGWIEAATWNYADGAGASDRWAGDTGNNGGDDAGCSVSGTDYNAAVIGSWTDPGTANTEMQSALTVSAGQDWVNGNNYGMAGIDGGGTPRFKSSDHATAAQRPKLVVVYSILGGDAPFSRIFVPGFRGAFG